MESYENWEENINMGHLVFSAGKQLDRESHTTLAPIIL